METFNLISLSIYIIYLRHTSRNFFPSYFGSAKRFSLVFPSLFCCKTLLPKFSAISCQLWFVLTESLLSISLNLNQIKDYTCVFPPLVLHQHSLSLYRWKHLRQGNVKSKSIFNSQKSCSFALMQIPFHQHLP